MAISKEEIKRMQNGKVPVGIHPCETQSAVDVGSYAIFQRDGKFFADTTEGLVEVKRVSSKLYKQGRNK